LTLPFCLCHGHVIRLLAVCCLLVQVGCGGGKDAVPSKPTFPVKGQVFFEDRPVKGALVVFHPLDDPGSKPVRSYARTEADGRFTLSTYVPQDGAPAGRYAVTIVIEDDGDGSRSLPARYASPQTSGFVVQVKEGNNQLQPFLLRRS
jgi:hypothetical protein